MKKIENVSDKQARNVIIAFSIVVVVLVAFLNWGLGKRVDTNLNLAFFPKFHAVLNSIVSILLVLGLYFAKNKQLLKHQFFMGFAFFFSIVFLVSYVIYHTFAEPTSYGGDGFIKYLYYFLLFTHIVLAAIITPFILMTAYYSLSKQFLKHMNLGKMVWPFWFYVAVTGVIIYLMISPYYPY